MAAADTPTRRGASGENNVATKMKSHAVILKCSDDLSTLGMRYERRSIEITVGVAVLAYHTRTHAALGCRGRAPAAVPSVH